MQGLSAVIPLLLYFLYNFDIFSTTVYVNITLFILAVIGIVWIMRKDVQEEKNLHPMGAGQIIGWVALGLLLAWVAQAISATLITSVLGAEQNSANTDLIVEISRLNPIFIIVPAVVGPVLEEFIFRKIIFGYFNARFNFWVGAIVSSLLFGLAHMEFTLLLVYVAMGFVFAFLYAKTKRIIIPIAVHMLLNSIAVIGQLVIDPEKLEQMMNETISLISIF